MYVRWKRKLYHGWRRDSVYLSAWLVESTRVNGKPRQKPRTYLGQIQERRMHLPEECDWFYTKVNASLDKCELDQETKTMILETLYKKVPLPPEKDYQKARIRNITEKLDERPTAT